ncbi:hypothetical protein [Neisseria bacilliformis]|uniref:hypothetical protein n=1 Tax=Neisseria bacilliformis TaxID=267212 RepID=UPI00128C342A|nr:hypothetical protein [Neisseria bacilliformis]
MLLFSPMWLHEVERLGFARCSRTAALLRAGSDCCTLAAIALLIAAFAVGVSAWYAAAVWLAGRILYAVSQSVAAKCGFRYNDDKIIASWRGATCRYTFRECLRDSGYGAKTWFKDKKIKRRPKRHPARRAHRRPSENSKAV